MPLRNRGTHSGALDALFAIAITTSVITYPFSSASSAQAPPAPARPELVLQTGHTGAINDIALSPDGRFLVSAGGDSTLKIWDLSTGNVLRTMFGHTKAVLAAAISHDGRWIASSGEDASVRVWDVTTGQSRTFGVHSTLVKDVAFSTDSRQLVSLGAGELRVWDVSSGQQLRETPILQQRDRLTVRVEDVVLTLTADGRFAAMAGGLDFRTGFLGFGGGISAKPIRIVETATGRDVDAFKVAGDIPIPTGLRFSPDGRMLVMRLFDSRTGVGSTLTVYEVQSGRVLKTFQSSDASPSGGIEFSPDSKLLASRVGLDSAAGGGSIELYDVVTWQRVRELARTGMAVPSVDSGSLAVTPLTFSGNGQWLAASLGPAVALFDATTGNRIRVLSTTMRTAAISNAPTNVPTAGDVMRQAGVPIDPSDLALLRADVGGFANDLLDLTRSNRGMRSPINFSPDGTRLSLVGSDVAWDTVAGMPVPGAETAGSPLAMVTSDGFTAFSPDGTLSADSGIDPSGTIVVVKEVATGRVIQTIRFGKASIRLPAQMPPGSPGEFDTPVQLSGVGFNTRGVVVQYCTGGFMGAGGIGLAQRQQMLGRLFGGGGGSDEECYLKTFEPRSGKELRSIRTSREDVLSSSGRFVLKVELGSTRWSGSGVPGFSLFGGGNFDPANVTELQPFTVIATDVETGRKRWEIKGVDDSTSASPTFTFSPTDAVVAVRNVAKDKPVLNLHDTASGRIVGSIGIANRTIEGITFSRDGKLVAINYGGGNSLLDQMAASGNARTGGNAVTVFDIAAGRPRFELVHDTVVDGATFSPDGRLVATIAQDRNQYLWDAQTGEKLATIVNLEPISFGPTAQEWLVVTPDGLFDGSPAAWQQIMWRFSQNTFDVGPVEIFFNELYYPGLASEIFAGRRPKATRDFQAIDRRQPTLRLSQPPAGEIGTREYTVRIEVAEAPADASRPQGSGARDVRLFRNGALVKVWRGDVLGSGSTATLEATLPIVAGANRLTVYAFNRENVKSADVSTTVIGSASLSRKGTAYVLAVGVNQYANAQYNLRFAVADATAFADEVKVQQEKLDRFDRVELIPLIDADATKSNLLYGLRRLAGTAQSRTDVPAALSRLNPVQPEDTVIVYFAGHGTARGDRFYLVPHDLGHSGSRTSVDAAAIETILAHSVSDLEIESALEGLSAQQVILVIDACNSGQALEAEEKRRGPMNSKGLAQLAYEKGMYILTAAQSYQAALETSQLGHGYLTFSLVEEGLKKGMADTGQRDGQVLVREWFDYATRRVPEMQATQSESRLLLEADNKVSEQNGIRNLQSPRAFYRRDVEAIPVVIAKP